MAENAAAKGKGTGIGSISSSSGVGKTLDGVAASGGSDLPKLGASVKMVRSTGGKTMSASSTVRAPAVSRSAGDLDDAIFTSEAREERAVPVQPDTKLLKTEAHEEERLDLGGRDVSKAISVVVAEASKRPTPVPAPTYKVAEPSTQEVQAVTGASVPVASLPIAATPSLEVQADVEASRKSVGSVRRWDQYCQWRGSKCV